MSFTPETGGGAPLRRTRSSKLAAGARKLAARAGRKGHGGVTACTACVLGIPFRPRTIGGNGHGQGLLIASMDLANVAEDEFHDWYDTEHMPERRRLPGFLACQRWIGAETEFGRDL